MDVDFIIPLSSDDLLTGEAGSYTVDSVFSENSLPKKLADASSDLNTDGPSSILRSFDTYFSLLRHFTNIDSSSRDEAMRTLIRALKQHANNVSPLVEPGADVDNETRKCSLNTLKMICYLVIQLSNQYEAEATKPTTQVTTGKGRGKSTKKKQSPNTFDWEEERNHVIEVVAHMVQLDINRLWNPPLVEEEFVNLITGFCYKLLENPAVTKNKTTKDLVFHLLATAIKKYNTGLGTTLKIIQLIQHFEHLVSHIAQAIELIATEFGVKSIVAEIIREIGMMSPVDLAKDTSGTRAYADFILDLSSRIPSLVLNNMSMLMCHLDGESYSMRNGVLGAMGEIVQRVLTKDELDDNAKNLRDQFLDRLELHIHDTNAYVRSKVLQIWLQLSNNMAIPISRQRHLLELVIGRLQDKSSIVRRYAMQLLKTFLVNNPFGVNLPLDQLRGKLEAEKTKLKEMAPHLVQQQPDQVPVVPCYEDIWNAMVPELQSTIKELCQQQENGGEDEGNDCEDQQPDQEQATETLELVVKEIQQLLENGHHKKALLTLKKAQKTWPEESLLRVPALEQEQLAFDDKESEEPDADRQITDTLCILKAIFMVPTDKLQQQEQQQQGQDGGELNANDLIEVANQSTETAGQENNEVDNEIVKQQLVVQYLQDYVDFQSQMEGAVPVICQLLGSKTTSDVSEAIEFFVMSYEFGLRNAIVGVRRMLVLIWSRDSAVQESVVKAYQGLYLDPPAPNQRAKTGIIVKNLIALTYDATIGDLTSLEELMVQLMKAKLIPTAVVKFLWEKFTMKAAQTTPEESDAALILLGMLASAETDIVRCNVDVLVSFGLGPRAEQDFVLARDTCSALLKLVKTKVPGTEAEEPFRFPATHKIFQRLTHLLVNGISRIDDHYYSPMAEQALSVIYALSEHPETVSENIIRRLVTQLIVKQDGQALEHRDGQTEKENDGVTSDNNPQLLSCNARVLSRFLVLCGHVALRQLVHMEMISKEIKRRQAIQEKENEEKMRNEKKGKKSRTESNTTVNTTKDTTTADNAEEEMGLSGATADDVEAEYIRKICEQDIVTGQNLLALVRPLLVCVCSNPARITDPGLQAAATLALTKFMLVSSEFCDSHLQLLFTILEKSPHATIRANTIIALGDLTFRFPNLLEPWTSHLYARLRDESSHVRKNTMMVLTHLILNDMVKVKGNISEMATCLEDKEQRIVDLAKLFFLELSKKGNAIYNVLPDIISRLSDPDCGIEEQPFRNILKYLLSFIQKDRQSESLVEKLCHRFRATRVDRQWRDLAFCLSLLPFNERGVRKLQENFGCFHDKLSDEDVYQSFTSIISKSKKFAKPEVKALVDELEQRIEECHAKGMEDEAGYERASKASGAAAKVKSTGKSTKPSKTPARRRRKTTVDSDSEDDQPARTTRTPRNPPPKKAGTKPKSPRKRKPMPSFESDEDDEIDLFDLEEEDEKDDANDDDDENNENIDPQENTKKNKPTNQSGKSISNGSRNARSLRT